MKPIRMSELSTLGIVKAAEELKADIPYGLYKDGLVFMLVWVM
jgi:hypothetical protein